jgi:hypothetical protein
MIVLLLFPFFSVSNSVKEEDMKEEPPLAT